LLNRNGFGPQSEELYPNGSKNYIARYCNLYLCRRKLTLYPNGDLKRYGEDHISLYLAIVDTENFISGWEVNVNFKFFVFDAINNNYLTIQGIYIYTTYSSSKI
jgi:hypothetical protein